MAAKSTHNLAILGNRFSTASLPVRTNACTAVDIQRNQLQARE